MEDGTETQTKNDSALRTPMAFRRAKASHLLSSLSPTRRLKHHTVDETATMKVKKDMADLKVKMARERLRNKRIKLWGSFELLLQLAVVFSVFALFLVLIFSGS